VTLSEPWAKSRSGAYKLMPTVSARLRSKHVFINCPFDDRYRPVFDAIVFAVYDLGFIARCSLEEDDAGDFRLSKIERMIEECRFGINDLSAVTLDAITNLPRFNMPLELALFLGCRRFGPQEADPDIGQRTIPIPAVWTFPGRIFGRMEAIPKTQYAKYETGYKRHLCGPGQPKAAKLLIGIASSGPTCLTFLQPLHSNRASLPSSIYPRL